jgi:mycothiol synthase
VILPPDGYTVRPSTRDDIETIARLVQAIDRHDEGIVEPVRDYIEHDWANPLFDPEQDTLVVAAETGDLASYGSAWGIDPSTSVEAWINIYPDHRGRGLGTWLVGWAEARSRRYLTRPGTFTLLRPIVSSSGAGGAFLQGLGYRHVRTFWYLERRLDGTETAGDAPDGRLDQALSGRRRPAVHRVLEAPSRVNSASSRWPTTRGRRPTSSRRRRISHSCSWPSTAGRVGVLTAGFLEEEAWVHELGVLEGHRGTGIGWALLQRVFAELAASGRTIVKLNVDGENRTGATRLYEGVGMRPWRSWHFYEKRIDAD